ncbi:uncharacterized protein LOC119667349 [Teleopsis dalmanni]|uniref:uncharacterized protein LOC119665634 n=1 Tax=Teleopsis dalmanni TaxID=139649 RepID=UPI0018CC98E9|nr:uncharacterized protein LOC119665634 [Teleopsis dalmanni]XP_037932567.1 uncharacterized protein LOC119667349 [Teleopsis dalmanni]
MDKNFDCMNSETLYGDNYYPSVILIGNTPYDYLKAFVDYLKNTSFPHKKVHFIDGMITTINAVITLSNEVLQRDTFFLRTKTLNQDRIENFFQLVKKKGGNNRNPSVAEIKQNFEHLMFA